MQPQERSWQQTIQVETGQLVDQVKRLIEEGNVRRIRIKQDDRTVVEFPLTLGVVGVVLAPTLAAVGAAAALLTNCTIEVERTGPPASGSPETSGGQEPSEPGSQIIIPPGAGGTTGGETDGGTSSSGNAA
jgi:hypothetical protein